MRYMKHMAQTITDNYNAFVGTVIAVISVIFGEHWYLFALFLALNIADWVTGWMKSRIMKKENSVKGWQGVLKKITTLLGWFVLASLIVNEARSICENFVEAGFNVPKVLSNGLAVADKLINKESEDEE